MPLEGDSMLLEEDNKQEVQASPVVDDNAYNEVHDAHAYADCMMVR